jgi:hypothetical protein
MDTAVAVTVTAVATGSNDRKEEGTGSNKRVYIKFMKRGFSYHIFQ